MKGSERNVQFLGHRFKTAYIYSGIREVDERILSTSTEQVEDTGLAVFQENMRRARSRPCRWDVMPSVPRWFLSFFISDDDRRPVVSISQFDTLIFVLAVVLLHVFCYSCSKLFSVLSLGYD